MRNSIVIIDKNKTFNPYHELEGLFKGYIDEPKNEFSDFVIALLSNFDWYDYHKISNNILALSLVDFPDEDTTVEKYLAAIDDTLNILRNEKNMELIIFEESLGFIFNPRTVSSIKTLEDYESVVIDSDNMYDVSIGLPEANSLKDQTQYWEPLKNISSEQSKKWWRFW